jgi:hypothetical protein
VEWDKQRLCVVFRDGYHRRERLNRKYRLRVKLRVESYFRDVGIPRIRDDGNYGSMDTGT